MGETPPDLLCLNVQDLILAGYGGHFSEKLTEACMTEAMPAGSKAVPVSDMVASLGL